jgi:hypothetical protein
VRSEEQQEDSKHSCSSVSGARNVGDVKAEALVVLVHAGGAEEYIRALLRHTSGLDVSILYQGGMYCISL